MLPRRKTTMFVPVRPKMQLSPAKGNFLFFSVVVVLKTQGKKRRKMALGDDSHPKSSFMEDLKEKKT